MSLARLIKRGNVRRETPVLTNQQLADQALTLDQDRRRAMRDSQWSRAIELNREIQAICKLMR